MRPSTLKHRSYFRQYGNQYPKNRTEVVNPFNDVFRTRDGKWVCICCPEYDRDYEKMFTVLDAPEMLTPEAREKYRRCEDINANGLNGEVVAALDRAIARFTREELMERLKASDMPARPAWSRRIFTGMSRRRPTTSCKDPLSFRGTFYANQSHPV